CTRYGEYGNNYRKDVDYTRFDVW
nr:immunoglobulin heavy chain junction region [Macaca mulatta]MOW97106.1 immunoglobulin heavy chain junction region [Macaca mulatta]MOW97411.1 immunoglobulin heavy chain junction region [Macaca mulatta]MOW97640.1 immunoglobulin heavy chain junction region [Macaca mulatta]